MSETPEAPPEVFEYTAMKKETQEQITAARVADLEALHFQYSLNRMENQTLGESVSELDVQIEKTVARINVLRAFYAVNYLTEAPGLPVNETE